MNNRDLNDDPSLLPEPAEGGVDSFRFGSRVSAHKNATDPIPIEVIESWLKGEYLVGITQSTGYQYIGWSLMLRGFYLYENEIEGKLAHWGYCYIDLKDGDLYYAGVRVKSGEEYGRVMQKETHHPIYWRSVFSKFVGLEAEDTPRLYFAYIAALLRQDPGDVSNNFFERYFRLHANGDYRLKAAELDRLKRMDVFWHETLHTTLGQDVLPDSPDQRGIKAFEQEVLKYLADRNRFDSDMALLEHLTPQSEILALVAFQLDSVQKETFNAKLYPLEPAKKIGDFTFRRLEHPTLE